MATNSWDAEAERLGATAARQLLDKGIHEKQVARFLQLRGITEAGARELVETAKFLGRES